MTNIKDDVLSLEEQQALLEKYDPESATRKLKGIMGWVVFGGLLTFSLFQLYTAIDKPLMAQLQRSVHLGFALGLVFLLYPARKSMIKTGKVAWYDFILSLSVIAVGLYWPIMMEELVMRPGTITSLDFFIGVTAVLLILEATRRTVGLPITIIAILFIIYALYGPYMPGFMAHRGLELDTFVQTMFFTTEGILGTPLAVSSTFIFLFLLFGAFLIKTGVGEYFNDLAAVIAGKRVGGPAKIAIFSSALQGTISGSSVANVVTSGAFTIPMMKRLGYKKEFAGAVEAASSTGGQLMPPIMGAAAFLMVEFIGGGITYWDIAKAAAIPAILYFTGIWIMTHFEAKRLGLRGLSDDEIPKKKEILMKIYLLFPIAAIIILLMTNMSVMRAALISIVVTILVSAVRKDTWIGFKGIINALVDGARTALSIAVATACAGIIVGVVTKTGLGLKMANSLVSIAESVATNANVQLLLTLFFTMIASLILGMGAPTTANYVITSTIAAPAIILMGVPELSAHLFVFYFGIVADITPPVALAAFAASGISGGEPIRTGIQSTKLAIAAFIIPYIFVLSPEMLMIDTTVVGIIWVVFTSICGMIAIGAGMVGFWYRKVYWYERVIAIIAGFLLIYPGGITDTIGLITFVGLLVLQYVIKGDRNSERTLNA